MKKAVLIVDDSESILEVVSFVLENAGFKVYKGVDGVDALNTIEDAGVVDLIITDLHMPNMDGISFIKKVRTKEDYKFTPILFLTTESQAEKKMQAKQAGATGWIVKPFVPEKLLAAISKVLR